MKMVLLTTKSYQTTHTHLCKFCPPYFVQQSRHALKEKHHQVIEINQIEVEMDFANKNILPINLTIVVPVSIRFTNIGMKCKLFKNARFMVYDSLFNNR